LIGKGAYYQSDERLRNLEQSRCTFGAVLKLMDVLDELGVSSQTLVVIVADHGSPSNIMNLRSRAEVEINRAFPLLLVRPIGSESPFEIVRRPASLADLPRTVADLLDLDLEFPGEHLFELPEHRERSYFHYRWEHRYWQARYLPPIQEFTITGFGRDLPAWRRGRRLEPAAH
jgi:arylsulfatase A-like enzyme